MSLERDLRELGEALAYPPTPELAGPVLARLERRPAARRLAPRLALAAAVVMALAVVTVAVVPPARQAVADLLGIGRVKVEVVPELPPVAGSLELGREVTLAEARAAAAAVPALVPAELGEPDAVYLGVDGAVSLAWAPRPGLPEVAGSGVGALLTYLPERGVIIAKQITVDTEARNVFVGGEAGLWLEGGPHVVFLEAQPGDAVETRGRLAGNTLLWVRGDVTQRLEADVDLDTALRIAESLR